MARPKFDTKELETIGFYPEVKTDIVKLKGIKDTTSDYIYNRPISTKDNFKLTLTGNKPYWIPRSGWRGCDINIFRPRMHPDNYATRIIYDAEEPPEYTSNKIISSWFDLEWEFSEVAGGATVHPGNPKVPNAANWEKFVSVPDPDELDYQRCAEINRQFLKVDKLNELGLLSGFWERLMALMDVDNAAIAMIDEDEKEGVHRLFERLTDLYIAYIRNMKTHFDDLDCVLIHDDWGHQHSTFFSIDTCREMLVPYYKRVLDVIHDLGMVFHLHSCGKNQTFVPAMLEAGVDMWCPQDMNDYEMLTQTYKDHPIVFALIEPIIPEGTDKEEIRRIAKEWVDTYKDCRVATFINSAAPALPEFASAIYEFSRKAYEDLD